MGKGHARSIGDQATQLLPLQISEGQGVSKGRGVRYPRKRHVSWPDAWPPGSARPAFCKMPGADSRAGGSVTQSRKRQPPALPACKV